MSNNNSNNSNNNNSNKANKDNPLTSNPFFQRILRNDELTREISQVSEQ